MAALAPTYSRQQTDELLALYDPHLFTPRHVRRTSTSTAAIQGGGTPTPSSLATTLTDSLFGKEPSFHRRTASIASSVRSYFVDRATITSSRTVGHGAAGHSSRPGSIRSHASRAQQLAPLLCLPSEILLHILDFAFPAEPHSRWTSTERNRLLCSLALVHPALRAWAQFELFGGAPVHLTTDLAIERLAKLTSAPGTRGHALASRITHVRVYGRHDTGDGGKTLAKTIHQLAGLEELHLEDLDGLELRQFVIHPPLRKLSVTRCGFRSRFRLVAAARPSHLESLSLTRCTGHHDSFSGFSLPQLRDLTIWNVSLPPPSPLATLEGSEAFRLLAQDVAPRLRSAIVDEQHFHYLFPLALSDGGRVPHSQLEALTLVRLGHLPTVLEQLRFRAPASSVRVHSIKKLHLVPTPSFIPGATSAERALTHFQALVAPFLASSNTSPGEDTRPIALKGVETIVLDWRYGAWLALGPTKSDESAKLADFVSRCERAGITVVVNEAPGAHGGGGGGGQDFYGPTMGARRASGLVWSANQTSDPMGLARTRSG
ncbi:hypothetical protein JCM10908_006553 [Rhodotorula pacifica]|uniref:uncharacterized protein n=1 Tax=Rhodotorula pacifica TaxID=1495444 RepID=UPI00317667BD